MSDLVKQMRWAAEYTHLEDTGPQWLTVAADRIEALEAENERLRALLDRINGFYRAGIDDRTFVGCIGPVLKEIAPKP